MRDSPPLVIVGEQGPELITVTEKICTECGARFLTLFPHRELCSEHIPHVR